MPRYEKWLHAATPNAPSDEVGRSALAERLLAVAHFLKKSVSGKDEAEAIHQLRVWTRRAGAALALFEPGIPKKVAKRMQKILRKLRRAAGGVRDCELQKERLQSMDDAPRKARHSLRKCQGKAERQLRRLRRHLRKGNNFDLEIEELLSRVAWPKRHSSRDAPPFVTLCRRQLRPLANEFLQQSKLNLGDFQHLHQMRIAGKRLRYALELAVAVIAVKIHAKLYDVLNELQDRAGEACDERAFLDSLQAWLDETKKKKVSNRLKKALTQQRRRYERAHRKFLRWWSQARLRQISSLWKKAL